MEEVEVDWNPTEESQDEIVFEAELMGDPEPTTVTMTNTKNPRIGGGTDSDTWWTGGPNLAKLTRPKSSNARRPSDLKSLSKVQDACEEGLSEGRQLGTVDDKDNNITVTSWVNEVRGIIEKRGMDTVFHIILGKSETNMLVEWGDISMSQVQEWVAQLKTTGVRQPDGTVAAVCTFDCDNLDWSATMLKNSITVRLWEEIESDLEYGATGPEIFVAIMSRFQHASSSAVRALVKKLEKLKLINEPGMNVDTFSIKVSDLVLQIQAFGKKSIPDDISSLVAQCYLDTDVDEFKLVASQIFNQVDSNPASKAWRGIITDLKAKYRSLDGLGRWPHKGKKDLADEIALLNGTVNSLTQKLANLKSSQGPQSQKRTCFNCGADDHLRKDCPKPPQNTNSDNSGTSTGGTGRHWTKIKPADGEPHTKTVNGEEYMYCDKCGRWRKGDNKHLTANHKTKAQIQGNGGSANVAGMTGVPDPDPATPTTGGFTAVGGSLQMMQGLFTGAICLPVDDSLN